MQISDMHPADIIRRAQSQKLFDEDGDGICISLLPPLTDAEIDEFAKYLPCALPDDIRELLHLCRGFSGVVADVVDFTGRDCSFEHETVFPYGLPIAADGFGNFWVVDLFPESTEFGPIYFACHDAPIVLYQSRTLSDFLTELFRACVSLRGSAIDDVHEDRIYNVWSTNPGVIGYEDCMRSSDRVLRSFAAELDPTWYVVDLRHAQPGMGFSWGRYGPNTNIRRCGTLPVFAVQKKGFLGPFFG